MFFLPELRKLSLYVSLSGKVFREKLLWKVLGFSIFININSIIRSHFHKIGNIRPKNQMLPFFNICYCWQSYKYTAKKKDSRKLENNNRISNLTSRFYIYVTCVLYPINPELLIRIRETNSLRILLGHFCGHWKKFDVKVKYWVGTVINHYLL
jgi:hypothetical protein